MKWFGAFALVLSGVAQPVFADPQADANGWLQKIVSAARKLNYSGTFTYSSGNQTETSKITQVADAAGERERLEVLDGSPREVVRVNSEVKCYLPEERTVIIDQSAHRRTFPGRLAELPTSIGENYHVRLGEVSRVAGRDSQVISLLPKDSLRYGHQLWADSATGLLLKARTIGEKGETIEQFAFADVVIGSGVDRERLKPKFQAKSTDWRVVNAKVTDSASSSGEWVFQNALPGFQQSAAMQRQVHFDRPVAYHVVFSDGLAAISVFIEPAVEGRVERLGMFVSGPFNVYKRASSGHIVTVLGEVPVGTLKQLGDGVEARRK